MHEHGPDCLEGPLRGSYAWWRGLNPELESSANSAKKTRRKAPSLEDKGIRKELVDRVRSEIAAGTYDTPEKWDAALDALLEGLE
jgi:hypothetical protein